MNAIVMFERAMFYTDRTRSARYYRQEVNSAFNDAIEIFITELIDSTKGKNAFQKYQILRDKLYPLIKTATPTVTTLSSITTQYGSFGVNHIDFPADYYELALLNTLISGTTQYARPTDYNLEGALLDDTFRQPTNIKPYYNEDSTGLRILRGSTGTLTTATLVYLKSPATYNCGFENQLINAGTAITNLASYIATEVSVQNAITYQPGDQFTATGTTLTSGQVILASNTTACDLPTRTHEDISKLAAQILAGNTSDYGKYQYIQKEVDKG